MVCLITAVLNALHESSKLHLLKVLVSLPMMLCVLHKADGVYADALTFIFIDISEEFTFHWEIIIMSVDCRTFSIILLPSTNLHFFLIRVEIGRSKNPAQSSEWGEVIVIADPNVSTLLRTSCQIPTLIATNTAYSTVHLQNCLNLWQNGDIKGAGFHSHGGGKEACIRSMDQNWWTGPHA